MEKAIAMSKINCHRKGCTRIRSQFELFLDRKRPPKYDGRHYCSERCLLSHAEGELAEKWDLLQHSRNHNVPRPKLGTILLERSFVTADQLEEAVRVQRQAREGRIGEWLLRLGFVEEHQITLALSKQCGIPMIHLSNVSAHAEAARMVPGPVARCSNLVPVGYGNDQSSLRIAVSGPVDFNSQEAIRRMVRRGVMPYIGDHSAILSLMERSYPPHDLDLSVIPAYSSLSELLEISRSIIRSAQDRRAGNVQFELLEEFFWARMDFENGVQHQFYRYCMHQAASEEGSRERQWAAAAVAAI
jgi:hypothetical protein